MSEFYCRVIPLVLGRDIWWESGDFDRESEGAGKGVGVAHDESPRRLVFKHGNGILARYARLVPILRRVSDEDGMMTNHLATTSLMMG